MWSIVNAFGGARSAYGYLRAELGFLERLRLAGRTLADWPPRILGQAREAARRQTGIRSGLAVIAMIGTAIGIGGAVGAITGPGRSPNRVA